MLRRLALFVVCLLWPVSAQAAVYYMSNGTHGETSASNANPCTGGGGNNAQNILYPKRWLTNTGGAGALSCLAAGDTLLIRGGTYDDGFEAGYNGITLASGTSWNNKIRIANYPNGCSPRAGTVSCGTPGEDVVLAPLARYTYSGNTISLGLFAVVQYVEFDGINIDNSVAAGGDIDGEVGLVCHNDGPHVMGANYIRFQNSEFVGNKGWYIEGGGGSAGGGDHFGIFKTEVAGCPGFHEIKNNRIHGGATNEVGWFANSTCCTYGRYTAYAVYLAADNTTIENNDIYDTRYYGMQIYASGLAINGAVVRNNKWHDIVRGGYKSGSGSTSVQVIVDTGTGSLIYNNLIYNNGTPDGNSYGIFCYDGASAGKYYNNTIYGGTGVGLVTSAGCSSSTIQNNILHFNAGGNYSNGGSGTTEDHNLRIGTDPNFVNAGAGDFHLSATSSAATDVGLCLGPVPTDYDGTARPQGIGCDIGAYEYLAAGALPGIPTNFVPASGSTISTSGQAFSWTATNATTFTVYFGSSDNLSAPLFSDAFTTPPLSASWVTGFVGWQAPIIFASGVGPANPTFPALAQTTATLNPEQWVSVIIRTAQLGNATVYASLQVGLRTGAAPNFSGYLIGATNWASLGCFIDRWEPGQIKTFLAGCVTPITWVDGDKLLATASRGTITGYRCNPTCTQIVQVQDSTYTTGRAAMAAYSDNFTVSLPFLDDLWAGNLGQLFVGTQAASSYTTASLVPGSPYYLDVIAKNAIGEADGPLQSYTATGTPATPVGIRVRFKAP